MDLSPEIHHEIARYLPVLRGSSRALARTSKYWDQVVHNIIRETERKACRNLETLEAQASDSLVVHMRMDYAKERLLKLLKQLQVETTHQRRRRHAIPQEK